MRIGARAPLLEGGGRSTRSSRTPTGSASGYIIADAGALLLLVSLILGGIGVRKLRTGGGAGLLKAAMVISLLILVAALVAVWAMSAKPT